MSLFCPHAGCVFSEASGKPLASVANLKQHIIHKHAAKTITCSNCPKVFATDWQLKAHLLSCGHDWRCPTCGRKYAERSSLLAHCSRLGHDVPAGAILRKKQPKQQPQFNVIYMPILVIPPLPLPETTVGKVGTASAAANSSHSSRTILPKKDANSETVRKSFLSCEVQTDKSSCKYGVQAQPAITSRSTGTTTTTKQVKTQSGTQTMSSATASSAAQCPPMRHKTRKRKNLHQVVDDVHKSIETQTSESVLNLERFSGVEVTVDRDVKRARTTVETATEYDLPVSPTVVDYSNPLLYGMSAAGCELDQSVAVQTDQQLAPANKTTQTITNGGDRMITDDLFSAFDLNDTETQTNWNADMTTQTDCEPVTNDDLFFEFDLNDNETQTNWNADSTDMTTQTDPLEELGDIDVQCMIDELLGTKQ